MSHIPSNFGSSRLQRKPLEEKKQLKNNGNVTTLVMGLFQSFPIELKNGWPRAAMHQKPSLQAKALPVVKVIESTPKEKSSDIDPALIPSKKQIHKKRQEAMALRNMRIAKERDLKYFRDDENLSLSEAFASLDPLIIEAPIEESPLEDYEELMQGSFMQMVQDEFEAYEQEISLEDEDLLDRADLLALSYLGKQEH